MKDPFLLAFMMLVTRKSASLSSGLILLMVTTTSMASSNLESLIKADAFLYKPLSELGSMVRSSLEKRRDVLQSLSCKKSNKGYLTFNFRQH